MKRQLLTLWKENKGFFVFIVLMFAFRSSFADWNTVPTGSMKPTILEGDRILVNKMAYDIRLPFTQVSLFELADPIRGDIIVFESEVSNKRLVKRVVGVPQDVIELKNHVLYVNGKSVQYQAANSTSQAIDAYEHLSVSRHLIRIPKAASGMGNFGPVEVPDDHYFTLGDNRGNSADSRVIGFVPRSEIIGRSRKVVISFNYENFYIPRANRFFHDI